MKDCLNKWIYLEILYFRDKFQEINNLDFVHPDDRDFVKNNLTNTFYQCIGAEKEYLIVRTRNYSLRIKPQMIKGFLPTPNFRWGDNVSILSKPESTATIEDLFWHHNKEEFLYYLKVDGKKKNKRYKKDDLKKCSTPPS